MSARRHSIRDRLVGRTMACVLLVFCAIALAAHLFARHESQEFFSARLASSARVLASLTAHPLETAATGLPVEIPLPRQLGDAGGQNAYGHPYEHKIAFQIWSNDGRLLVRSSSAPSKAFGARVPGFSQARIDGNLWQVFTLQSGPAWIQAAEKEEVRDEMVHQLTLSVLVPVLLGAILLVLALNLVLSTSLAPLRRLADSIARRQPESLAPLELVNTPDELAPVINELNNLLMRVRRAFEREQQFIDAAAHEIRTPIAAVQLHVQNALRAYDERERNESLNDANAALKRTALLAEQLLTFSRLASKTDLILHEWLSLSDVCREVIELHEPLLERRGQTVGLNAQSDLYIEGDPYRLEQLLRNLIDNASLHGRADGNIDVTLASDDGHVLLSVSNDGEPIPLGDLELVFEPYVRLRPRNASGAGLGLSIVREVARQHSAEVSIGRKPDGQGCVVTVVFALPAPVPDTATELRATARRTGKRNRRYMP